TVRGQQVLLDRDVAELYGVETKRINEAVKNNQEKFPNGYTITLDNNELCKLVENFDRFNSLKHSTASPTAFTEKGLYMLATILKSPTATQTTLAIVETFSKIREFARVVAELPDIKEEAEMNALVQKGGDMFLNILEDSIMEVTGDEISFELDLPILKVKRIVKRKMKKPNDLEA
ncbi:MAG: ORF6N domain-containing protein, partial [Oscillospiraceae bacterium]|nr:ORF6N domain-containing protein [Oscillospiraceae bacterium]